MLTERETLIALVANGIAVYSMLIERDEISDQDSTMYGFVLDAVPPSYRHMLTSEIIDDVFEAVTAAHNS